MRREGYEKIVRWGRISLDGKVSFWYGLIMMIPIINIIFASILMSIAWDNRSVSWKKIKIDVKNVKEDVA